MNVDSTRGQSYGKGMSAAQLEFNNNITHQTAKRQEYDESGRLHDKTATRKQV